MDLVCEDCEWYVCQTFEEECDTPRPRNPGGFVPPSLESFLEDLVAQHGGCVVWRSEEAAAEAAPKRLVIFKTGRPRPRNAPACRS